MSGIDQGMTLRPGPLPGGSARPASPQPAPQGSDQAPPSPAALRHGAPDAHTRALSGAVRAVSGMTLLSRIGGLVRDVLVGRIFGDTWVNSAFAAAFAIPNMFRRLFGEGALSAAFIPEYTAALKESKDHDALASLTVTALAAVAGGLTAAIELALLLLLLFLPHDPERALSLRLMMVMLPFMPLICIVAILGGILQVQGKFAAAASGPLVLNGFIVGVGVWCIATNTLAGERTAYALGVATVLSGVTQAVWFAWLLRGKVRWAFAVSAARDRARRMLRRFVPVMIGLGTLQLNTFMDTLIAMWPIWVGSTLLGMAYPLDGASNGILSLTARLYQFPLGVFGIAVATAAFPMLARHADQPPLFAETLRRGARMSLFIGVPASIGMVLVRHDITAVLFARGGGRAGFSPEGIARSAAVLLGFAPAIWAYSLNHVFTRAFYARQDTRTPMAVAMGMVVLNLTLNLILIWPLREAGLAWATSISATVQCLILGVLCHRKLGVAVLDRPTGAAFARIAIAGGIMALLVVGARWAVAPRLSHLGVWTGSLVMLALTCGVGVLGYLAAAFALRLHEMGWLLKRR